jgi:hypothetical protein
VKNSLKFISLPLLHQGDRWFRNPIPWFLLATGIAIAVFKIPTSKGLLLFAAFLALIGGFQGMALGVRWMMKRKLAGSPCPVCGTRFEEEGATRAFAEYTAKCRAFAEPSEDFLFIDHGSPMDLACPTCGRRLWFNYLGDGSLAVDDGSISLADAQRFELPLRNEVFAISEGALRGLLEEPRDHDLPIQSIGSMPLAEMDPTPSTFYFGEPAVVILQLLACDPPGSPRPDRTMYGVLLGQDGEEVLRRVEDYLARKGLQSTGQGAEEFNTALEAETEA